MAKGWGRSSVVECLLSIYKVLSLVSIIVYVCISKLLSNDMKSNCTFTNVDKSDHLPTMLPD